MSDASSTVPVTEKEKSLGEPRDASRPRDVQGQIELPAEVRDLLRYINATPALLSLLYDLDLMPEQLERFTRPWGKMLIIAKHFQFTSASWRDLKNNPPKLMDFPDAVRRKPYVLAVDGKGRMSVGYAYRYSTGETGWVFAKPIGEPTHWMPLPEAPSAELEGNEVR